MSDDLHDVTGGCYCGRVRYRAATLRRDATECHCSQCRKQSGHRYATAGTAWSAVAIDGADAITWFRASPDAARGFCAHCGSHLFWKRTQGDYVSVLAASLDDASGLRLAKHIFVADKPAYYAIADGLPQFADYSEPVAGG